MSTDGYRGTTVDTGNEMPLISKNFLGSNPRTDTDFKLHDIPWKDSFTSSNQLTPITDTMGEAECLLNNTGQSRSSNKRLTRLRMKDNTLMMVFNLARLLKRKMRKNRILDFDVTKPEGLGYEMIHSYVHGSNEIRTHNVCWFSQYEVGYKYDANNNRIPIHDALEDISLTVMMDFTGFRKQEPVSDGSSPRMEIHMRNSASESKDSRAFMSVLADGHGGPEAALFFVNKVKDAISLLIESREWDLSLVSERRIFEKETIKIFDVLDKTYIERKINEYERWNSLRADSTEDVSNLKPKDDGCTLVVNLIFKNYLININTGDSRTVAAVKSSPRGNLESVFVSEDHNMAHMDKMKYAHDNGAKLVSRNGIVKNFLETVSNIDDNSIYCANTGLRLYRPPTSRIKDLFISHNRTLNLSAAMGDLLFKVDPSIVSCQPDVKFTYLDPKKEYLILAATDGVWDHVDVAKSDIFRNRADSVGSDIKGSYQKAQTQLALNLAESILYGSCKCRRGSEREDHPETLSGLRENEDSDDIKPENLKTFASVITTREPKASPCKCTKGFFYENLSRYDDSTSVVIWLRPRKDENKIS